MKLEKYLIGVQCERNSTNCNGKTEKFGTFSQILNENGQNICLYFLKNKNDLCILKAKKSIKFIVHFLESKIGWGGGGGSEFGKSPKVVHFFLKYGTP